MFTWFKVCSIGLVLVVAVGCSNSQKQFNSAEVKPADENSSAKESELSGSNGLAEADMVSQLRRNRADYKRMLEVLHRWYIDRGLHDKATWASSELHDLNRVRTYSYMGEAKNAESTQLGTMDETRTASLQSIDLANFSEADRIEQLSQVRTNYKLVLQSLLQSYRESGQTQKAGWASKELDDLRHVRKYPYLVEVDIQDTNLSPRDSIVEADRLYEEGVKLLHGGKFLPFINDKRKLKDAMDKFTMLIKAYPTSDKIDDAAFYAGEISKEYFNDDVQALRYYEMALKWNPKTPHPVRFEAAVIYDFRRHDRARAMDLYQQVLKDEADIDQTNTSFSATRLNQLLREKEEGTVEEGAPKPTAGTPSSGSPSELK
ncbi:MAG: hypothetical protein WC975_05610 [Phycisphaerae bacterium]